MKTLLLLKLEGKVPRLSMPMIESDCDPCVEVETRDIFKCQKIDDIETGISEITNFLVAEDIVARPLKVIRNICSQENPPQTINLESQVGALDKKDFDAIKAALIASGWEIIEEAKNVEWDALQILAEMLKK
jgi:hypothetical protein